MADDGGTAPRAGRREGAGEAAASPSDGSGAAPVAGRRSGWGDAPPAPAFTKRNPSAGGGGAGGAAAGGWDAKGDDEAGDTGGRKWGRAKFTTDAAVAAGDEVAIIRDDGDSGAGGGDLAMQVANAPRNAAGRKVQTLRELDADTTLDVGGGRVSEPSLVV
jgi:hypothetical protein